jgi:hypothetical protein
MVSAADAGRVRLNDQAVRPVGRTALEELHFHWQSGLSYGHLAESSSPHWPTASADGPS